MFCRFCGREIPEKALFCPYCGASLKASPGNFDVINESSPKKAHHPSSSIEKRNILLSSTPIKPDIIQDILSDKTASEWYIDECTQNSRYAFTLLCFSFFIFVPYFVSILDLLMITDWLNHVWLVFAGTSIGILLIAYLFLLLSSISKIETTYKWRTKAVDNYFSKNPALLIDDDIKTLLYKNFRAEYEEQETAIKAHFFKNFVPLFIVVNIIICVIAIVLRSIR